MNQLTNFPRSFATSAEPVYIKAELLRETDKVLGLFNGKTAAWVPKSLVKNNGDGTFKMPEWLAVKMGFI